MANIEIVKQILNNGIRFGAVGRIHSKQINEAADRLLLAGEATADLLEQIGHEICGDRLVFCDVDIDHLNRASGKKDRVVQSSNDFAGG